jgi:hypothetical protein
MPRFHFNILDGSPILDLQGRDFPTLDAARKEATALLRQFRDEDGVRAEAIRITDDSGHVVACVKPEH